MDFTTICIGPLNSHGVTKDLHVLLVLLVVHEPHRGVVIRHPGVGQQGRELHDVVLGQRSLAVSCTSPIPAANRLTHEGWNTRVFFPPRLRIRSCPDVIG